MRKLFVMSLVLVVTMTGLCLSHTTNAMDAGVATLLDAALEKLDQPSMYYTDIESILNSALILLGDNSTEASLVRSALQLLQTDAVGNAASIRVLLEQARGVSVSPAGQPSWSPDSELRTEYQTIDSLERLSPVATLRVPGASVYVYTGPGAHYYRARNTKGCLKSGSLVTAYGTENGWLLVRYDGGDNKDRFGFVQPSDLNVSAYDYPQLSLGRVSISIGPGLERIGDGPTYSHYFSTMQKTIDRDNATALAKFSEGGTTWIYFESTAIDEKQGYKSFRGFVKQSDMREQ